MTQLVMNFHQSTDNEEPGIPDYDYGYEDCAPTDPCPETERVPTPLVHWNSEVVGQASVSLARPCPMPADRLARKQRSFSRRGGVGHSQLLKSAVLAAMDALDSSEDESRSRGSSHHHQQQQRMPMVSYDAAPTSPRKRARLFTAPASSSGTAAEKERDIDVASASVLMGALTTGETPTRSTSGVAKEPVRGVPRRTSRRTSYGSKISDVSDCDLDSFAD